MVLFNDVVQLFNDVVQLFNDVVQLLNDVAQSGSQPAMPFATKLPPVPTQGRIETLEKRRRIASAGDGKEVRETQIQLLG